MKLYIFFFILILLSFFTQVHGQSDYIQSVVKIPPSPTAASLGKYGEVAISEFTGIPNIVIPIWDVDAKSVNLSVNLSYHSSGYKISDRASWVGLGWALNAGGVITRVIQGLPDEGPNGYNNIIGSGGSIDAPDPITDRTNFGALPQNLTTNQKTQLASGAWDGLPDTYYYNFAGRSGKILITKRGIYTAPYSALKTERVGNNWQIIDEAGVKYVFGTRGSMNGIETTSYDNTNAGPGGLIPDTQTAWYLVEVVPPNGNKIELDYVNETYSMMGQDAQTKQYYATTGNLKIDQACASMTGDIYSSASRFTISAKRLTAIRFGNGEIRFRADTLRKDIFVGDQLRRLDHIEIYEGTSKIRQYNLSYSYLGNSNGSTSTTISSQLMLGSVREVSETGIPKQPYIISYNLGNIPASNSYSIDHWGFYNGKSNGSNMVPKQVGSVYDNYFYQGGAGADRTPDTIFSKIGLIKTLSYPTGGYTEFNYERHDYANTNGTDYPGEYKRTGQFKSANVSIPSNGANAIKEVVTPFTIDFAQDVTVSYGILQQAMEGRGEQYLALYKVGQTAPILVYTSVNEGTRTEFRTLSAGDYTIVAHIEDKGYSADINVSYEKYDYSIFIKNLYAGGLRIKSIANYGLNSQNAEETVTYSYRLDSDNQKSSGILNAKPVYEYTSFKWGTYQPTVDAALAPCRCKFISRTSASTAPLGGADGGHVTYREVLISKGAGNGSVKKWYTSAIDYNDEIFSLPPFAPTRSNADKRGLLKRQAVFNNNGRLIEDLSNVYEYNTSYTSPNLYGSPVLVVAFEEEHSMYPSLNKFFHVLYDNRSSWTYIKSATKREYNYSSANVLTDSLSTNTVYTYGNPSHIQRTHIELAKSDGSREVTLTSYPDDYANGTAFIDNMKRANGHLIGYPIEQVRYKEVGTTRTILSGQITRYLAGGKGLVDQVLELETLQPIALSAFKFSNRAAGQLPPADNATAFTPFSGYKTRLTYSSYDSYGNPQQVTPADGPSVVYLWGYGGQYPVAEIRNATYSEVTNTGVSTAILNNIASTDAQRTTELNKIRNNATLKKSLISTYLYRPLVGMSRATDASGRTTYYSYDGFGRLQEVKDTQQKTKESFNYHYRNQ